jgi:homoserine dehydrogenase
MQTISVGLIGFGTVGTGVAKILEKNAGLLYQRIGANIELKKIADLDIKRSRGMTLQKGVLTTSADELVNNLEIDIVVELMGGIEPARGLILKALGNGKHVVTANKALLSAHGWEIFSAARLTGVDVAFEASVGGGIPIIRTMQEGFASDRISGFLGILNGTSNYILSRMTDEGADFKAVLKDAQAQGYAEADPTFDVEGIDTAHKLNVLLSLSFGGKADPKKIYTEGISSITPLDIDFARQLGYKIKLLAICSGHGSEVDARVHPSLIPEKHMLAQVGGAFNAIFVQGQDVGPTMFYGRGAGMMPTGSAVVADIVSIARNIVKGVSGRVPLLPYGSKAPKAIRIKPMSDVQTRYYLRFTAVDKPGVLSSISGALGRNHISIHSVVQKGRDTSNTAVSIFMLTHEAKESDLQKAIRQLEKLSMLKGKTMVIRIVEDITAAG